MRDRSFLEISSVIDLYKYHKPQTMAEFVAGKQGKNAFDLFSFCMGAALSMFVLIARENALEYDFKERPNSHFQEPDWANHKAEDWVFSSPGDPPIAGPAVELVNVSLRTRAYQIPRVMICEIELSICHQLKSVFWREDRPVGIFDHLGLVDYSQGGA